MDAQLQIQDAVNTVFRPQLVKRFMQSFLPKEHSAILIFGRTVSDETRAKNFVSTGGFKANRLVSKSLYLHTEKIASESGLPYFIVDSNHQKGSNFSEKIKAAYQSVFDKGFKNVIVIGTDCPTLSSQSLVESANLLRQKSVVIGPDNRGGLFLIGLSKNAFTHFDFDACRWETKETLVDFKNQFTAADIDISAIAAQSDINNFEDAWKHLRASLKDWFSIVLQRLIYLTHFNYSYVHKSLNTLLRRILLLRGPPTLV